MNRGRKEIQSDVDEILKDANNIQEIENTLRVLEVEENKISGVLQDLKNLSENKGKIGKAEAEKSIVMLRMYWSI